DIAEWRRDSHRHVHRRGPDGFDTAIRRQHAVQKTRRCIVSGTNAVLFNRVTSRRLRIYLAVAFVAVCACRPAFAQTDLAGSWVSLQHEDGLERGAGPSQVDYTGLPLNEEGRAKALSYSPSQFAMIERQCAFWPPHYIVMGPWGLRIWPQLDP